MFFGDRQLIMNTVRHPARIGAHSRLCLNPVARALLAAGVLLSPTLHAQQAGRADTAEQALQDVVVTASRSEQREFDAPAAINAVTVHPLDTASPLVNLSELLAGVPGIQARERQNYAQDLQISSRGFGTRSTFGVRGVRVLVDGIPATMPDGQGQAATAGLQSASRVEVLRGPMAQLYGNSAGGVIQVFTKEPPRGVEATGSAGAGSDGQRLVSGSIAGGNDTVGALLDVTRYQSDGYRDHSAVERTQINAKVVARISSATKITGLLNTFDQPDTEDPLGLNRADYEANPRQVIPNAIRFNTRKSIEQQQAGVVLDHALSATDSITARAYGGRRDVDQKLAFETNGVVGLDRSYGGVGVQWKHKTRVAGLPFEWTVGTDFDRMREKRTGHDNLAGENGTLRRDEIDEVRNQDVFAQLSWMVAPEWTLNAGVRRSVVKFDVDDRFNTGARSTSMQTEYSNTSPVAGVVWHANESINVYGNIGTGFETPTLAESAYRPDGSPGFNAALRPAKSLHSEVGIKVRAGRHTLDAALFHARSRDEIVSNTSANGRAIYQNADRVIRRGIETSWKADWSRMTTRVAYTLLDAKFDTTFTGASGTVPNGNRLPGAPMHSLFADVETRLTESLRAGLELRADSKVYVNDMNADAAEGYGVVNLRSEYGFRAGAAKMFVFGRVDNVLDKQYAGSVIVNDQNGRFFESAPGRRLFVGVRAVY
jgi:iron complex outermembrane receptor protein